MNTPPVRVLGGSDVAWWRSRQGPLGPRVRAFVAAPRFRDATHAAHKPKITVVTPSYNQGLFLEETILSVLNQGYGNLEYFIMDGGSTDNSVEIIRKYERHLAGWASEPDAGQADAIAKGFRRATGAVLGWINSDDLLLPHALDHVGRAFEEFPGTQYAFGHAIRCDESTFVTDIHFTYPGCYWPQVHRADNVFQGSVFWSREAYERAGGLDTRLAFAMEYPLIHYLMGNESGVFINAPLAAFRQHREQKTQTIANLGLAEVEELFGPTKLPTRWAMRIFARRIYQMLANGNLWEKLRFRAAAERARNDPPPERGHSAQAH